MTIIKNNGYILFILLLCVGFALVGVGKSINEQAYTEITIVEGDTLWDLANQHSHDTTPEKWIEDVMIANDMTSSTIRSGESLLLPVQEKLIESKFGTQMAGDEN